MVYDSPHLVITGASAEHLLAMKLEAARRTDQAEHRGPAPGSRHSGHGYRRRYPRGPVPGLAPDRPCPRTRRGCARRPGPPSGERRTEALSGFLEFSLATSDRPGLYGALPANSLRSPGAAVRECRLPRLPPALGQPKRGHSRRSAASLLILMPSTVRAEPGQVARMGQRAGDRRTGSGGNRCHLDGNRLSGDLRRRRSRRPGASAAHRQSVAAVIPERNA